MLRRFRLALLIVCALAAPAAAFKFTDCGGHDCQWQKLPISFFIQSPLGPPLDDAVAAEQIQAAFQRWDYHHQTFCPPLEFEYKGRVETSHPAAHDGQNVVHFETQTWIYGAEALAITTVWYDNTGYLREADVAFNAVDYQWTTEKTDVAKKTYAILPTLTHEAGHCWGLDHSTNDFATMYAYYKPAIKPEDLDADDIFAAAQLYCQQTPPLDDPDEQNDSFSYFTVIDDLPTVSNLRLYDEDWYRLNLAEGMRLKLTVTDEIADRYKRLELYDIYNDRLDHQPCFGECVQALGEAGKARQVALRIDGDLANHHLEAGAYGLQWTQVAPGQEGALHDDDDTAATDDDNDDDNRNNSRGCACDLAGGAGAADAALVIMAASGGALLWRRRRAASSGAK